MALDPNKKFLYFNKDATITEMDLALCFPISSFIGIEVQTSSIIDFYFEGSKGTDATVVKVNHVQYAYIKSFMISLVDEINFGEKAFIRVMDYAKRGTDPSDVSINMVLSVAPVFTLEDNDFVIADDVSIGGNLTFDSVALTNIQTSAESFVNDDISLMTSAATEDKILSYGYSAGDITSIRITTDSGAGVVASVTSGSADFSILGATGVGVTNSGTTITAVAVPGEIDHDSLQNFSADEHYTQANIVATGTIASGTWEGTTIKTAYIGDDQVTEDKLANTLLAEIDANTAKVTNSDQSKADINALDITEVGTISSGVWQGTDVGVAHGGTGLSTVGTNEILTGNGTGALTSEALLTFTPTRLVVGSNSDQAPHIRLYNDENYADIGISNAADGHISGSADGDLVINGSGDHKVIIGQNNAAAITIDDGACTLNREFAVTGDTDGTASGDVVYFGGTTSMTVGTIYHYKSDGTWEVSDANDVTKCDGLLAVALGAASDTNGMLLRGMVTLDHDPGAVGDVLFLSNTAGDASVTAPSDNNDVVRVIGYCLHASNGQIWFNPDNTYVKITA